METVIPPSSSDLVRRTIIKMSQCSTMELVYLVEFHGQRKQVEVEAKSEVENGIRSIFKIRPNAQIIIQRLDPDWQEYVDIEDAEADLGNREKLKVLLLETSNATSADILAGATVPLPPLPGKTISRRGVFYDLQESPKLQKNAVSPDDKLQVSNKFQTFPRIQKSMVLSDDQFANGSSRGHAMGINQHKGNLKDLLDSQFAMKMSRKETMGMHKNKQPLQYPSRQRKPTPNEELNASDANHLKEKIRKNSTKIDRSGDLDIYQLNMTKTVVGSFDHFELGSSKVGVTMTEKVLLVVGATGAGKTSLIDSLVNFSLGVQYSDKFRFKLVPEKLNKSQAHSQTQKISTYTLHHEKGFGFPFTISIVDTPGFGDTGGIERDFEITANLHDFIKSEPCIVTHVDVVGFVANASLPRLTETQRYIFTSILSLFGKDIGENIFLLFTFADGNTPQILSAVQEGNIPHQGYFKFNNSAVFNSKSSNAGGDVDDDDGDDDDDDDGFNKFFWKIGMKSFTSFSQKMLRIQSKSLNLTRDVLDQRQRLETSIHAMHKQVTLGLIKLEELTTEKGLRDTHKQAIAANKDFEYEVDTTKCKEVDLDPGTFTTLCNNCRFTCHEVCVFSNDEDKRHCAAMDYQSPEPHCNVCAEKCIWKVHTNASYKLEFYQVKEKKTWSDLKNRYEEAQGQELSAQQIVTAIEEDFDAIQGQIMHYISEIKNGVAILKNIALKDSPIDTLEYIDLMIQSEKSEGKPGWQKRVDQLKKVRERTSFLIDITHDDFDPFKEYADQCKQAKLASKQSGSKAGQAQAFKNVQSKVGKKKGTGFFSLFDK